MTKKLILCAPLAMALASCSTTRMGDVVPESRDSEYGNIAVHGFNTGSVITYGKNYKTGYMETAGVTVYHDSGIDNATKLAHAAGSVAMGTGSVLQGIGHYKYGRAWQALATGGDLDIRHHGIPGTNINVENGNHVAGSFATSESSAGASAEAKAKSKSEASAGASADIKIKGGMKPPHKPKPPHGGHPHGGHPPEKKW